MLAIRFGFEQLGLGRIEADPALDNVAAHKVLEKVGMHRVDLRPQLDRSPSGLLRDAVVFAILRDDFQV